MTSIGGWPARLKDVPYQFEALTTRPLASGRMTIAVGAKVQVIRGAVWHGFTIRTPECKCCGVGLIINKVSRDDLQPIFYTTN